MTPEEFSKWFGNMKIEISVHAIAELSRKKIRDFIKIGREYWFFNVDTTLGPADWMKMKVTYKRSGVYSYKVLDKRYKMTREEEYADIDSPFTLELHPAVYKNPNPEYLKLENFDTLDGRIKII